MHPVRERKDKKALSTVTREIKMRADEPRTSVFTRGESPASGNETEDFINLRTTAFAFAVTVIPAGDAGIESNCSLKGNERSINRKAKVGKHVIRRGVVRFSGN